MNETVNSTVLIHNHHMHQDWIESIKEEILVNDKVSKPTIVMAANLIDDFYDGELDDNDLSMDVFKGYMFEVENGPQWFDFS